MENNFYMAIRLYRSKRTDLSSGEAEVKTHTQTTPFNVIDAHDGIEALIVSNTKWPLILPTDVATIIRSDGRCRPVSPILPTSHFWL
jgi:hypothetical protein